MNLDRYRKSWIRAHKSYERKSYNILRNAFRKILLSVPITLLNEQNYKELVELAVSGQGIEDAYYNIYKQVGLIHGNRVGKGINKELKDFNGLVFDNAYLEGLYKWVMENVGYRIETVKQTYVEYIQNIIGDAFREGKTVRDIAKDIEKLVNRRDFYRWQALRIARTETTAAANKGALTAGRTSRIVMDKIWISAHDARTRRRPDDEFDHYVMHLKKVPLDKPFNVGGELLEYPGAPNTAAGGQTSAGNVINCRCTVAEVPRRDSNGRLVRQGSEGAVAMQRLSMPTINMTGMSSNMIERASTMTEPTTIETFVDTIDDLI